MNRLKDETSPYLLQHANNPVNWYPWGEEAFEAAKTHNKPIMLSVGYSACHWCHVMEHESFEHEPTAQMMNEWFINIKVDREERPDVDDIYMGAVQAMTGQGGWPMTVFLLPTGEPFYGGTYYPREPRYGMPSFQQVLEGVYDAYVNRHEEIKKAAANITQTLNRDLLHIDGDADGLSTDLLDKAAQGITGGFDRTHGGFGRAPKFPAPMSLDFLLRTHHRTQDNRLLDVVTFTLDKMARGGIYDQLGGGFHRYSVDTIWLVPHFEKMLYDNAQLSRVYLHAWQVTCNSFFKQIAEEIYDYILREMTAPDGGFYSTTDADSDGEEGKFFVWSKAELEEVLGEDAPIAIEYWGVTGGGNFEGHTILNVPNDNKVVADRLKMDVDTLHEKLAAIKDTLYAHRTHRVHPGLDNKILSSWNGMMLASLAEAARVLGRDDYLTAAERNAEFLLSQMVDDRGRLYRTHKDGTSKLNGYLEDYANVIDGLLELYQSTFMERWFVEARRLADVVLAHFRAPDGGFFDTSDDHEQLIIRPRNLQDNATPSGNGMIAKQLLRLAAYTGEAEYDEAARGILVQLMAPMQQYPQAFPEYLNAADMAINGLAEVAIVGNPVQDETKSLLSALREPYHPRLISALAREGQDGDATIPLLSYRTLRSNQPTVYVCRNFACANPVNTPEDMVQLIDTGV